MTMNKPQANFSISLMQQQHWSQNEALPYVAAHSEHELLIRCNDATFDRDRSRSLRLLSDIYKCTQFANH
jgi:hypothetical protein